ncbi:MAG: hypothetical protein LAQ30_15605 [Acidobacteriia bacterium]|nr:hypothetical protein [Terriglobia bacterium]
MSPLGILDELSPHVRVATAVAPFCIAMALRVVAGRSKAVGALISAGVVWFALNVLAAPFSAGMQRDLGSLQSWFR